MIKQQGYTVGRLNGVLEVTSNEEDCLKTATMVAAMASWAYAGDVRFFKLGCEKGAREYQIKLFSLGKAP